MASIACCRCSKWNSVFINADYDFKRNKTINAMYVRALSSSASPSQSVGPIGFIAMALMPLYLLSVSLSLSRAYIYHLNYIISHQRWCISSNSSDSVQAFILYTCVRFISMLISSFHAETFSNHTSFSSLQIYFLLENLLPIRHYCIIQFLLLLSNGQWMEMKFQHFSKKKKISSMHTQHNHFFGVEYNLLFKYVLKQPYQKVNIIFLASPNVWCYYL